VVDADDELCICRNANALAALWCPSRAHTAPAVEVLACASGMMPLNRMITALPHCSCTNETCCSRSYPRRTRIITRTFAGRIECENLAAALPNASSSTCPAASPRSRGTTKKEKRQKRWRFKKKKVVTNGTMPRPSGECAIDSLLAFRFWPLAWSNIPWEFRYQHSWRS
jgi:hypothetical protein